jgi:hypothetical protein
MATLTEQNAILHAQVAALTSDDELRREASFWRGASPEECLAATFDLCAEGDAFLAALDPVRLERALAPDPLPADALELLRAMHGRG